MQCCLDFVLSGITWSHRTGRKEIIRTEPDPVLPTSEASPTLLYSYSVSSPFVLELYFFIATDVILSAFPVCSWELAVGLISHSAHVFWDSTRSLLHLFFTLALYSVSSSVSPIQANFSHLLFN